VFSKYDWTYDCSNDDDAEPAERPRLDLMYDSMYDATNVAAVDDMPYVFWR